MTTPQPGDIWIHRETGECRQVIPLNFDGACVRWQTFGCSVGGVCDERLWSDWSASAVRVWTPPAVTVKDLKPRRIELDEDDLPPEAAKPAGETVNVRAAVAYNPDSEDMAVAGYHVGGDGDRGLMDDAIQRNGGGYVIAFIEAEILLPPVPTVVASVETAEPGA